MFKYLGKKYRALDSTKPQHLLVKYSVTCNQEKRFKRNNCYQADRIFLFLIHQILDAFLCQSVVCRLKKCNFYAKTIIYFLISVLTVQSPCSKLLLLWSKLYQQAKLLLLLLLFFPLFCVCVCFVLCLFFKEIPFNNRGKTVELLCIHIPVPVPSPVLYQPIQCCP